MINSVGFFFKQNKSVLTNTKTTQTETTSNFRLWRLLRDNICVLFYGVLFIDDILQETPLLFLQYTSKLTLKTVYIWTIINVQILNSTHSSSTDPLRSNLRKHEILCVGFCCWSNDEDKVLQRQKGASLREAVFAKISKVCCGVFGTLLEGGSSSSSQRRLMRRTNHDNLLLCWASSLCPLKLKAQSVSC